MKLGDFIHGFAVKAGKQNEQAIIDILSRADLQNVDIEDSVANAIANSLLTVDAAKNNAVVKNHFNAQILNAFDAEISEAVDKLELGDDFKTELTGIKSTYEKQRKLAEKIKETVDSLKASQGKGDDKAIERYTKQINELQTKYAKLQETTIPKTELEKVKKENENAVRDFMLHSKISGLKFANQDVNHDDNVAFANVILGNRLSKAKAVIVKDGNDLKLKQAEDQALDYFDEQNKPVSFDDFMNKAFADAKILAVSGPQNPNTPPVPPVIPPGGGQPPVNAAQFNAAIQASLGDLSN
ncbi:MAG: hypothetical protein LBP72_01100 [Dysgonamonadaceae bacterium]|jgi:hypothetical protein|nr:hypothetical protein [Dysgonamonadaceae bacterium]